MQNISCPSPYFLGRGFDQDILSKYCVGEYLPKYRLMSGRAVVPVFNHDGTKVIGASGRLPHSKCLVCCGYHHKRELCPDNEQENFSKQKWIHSKGFQRNNYLYNLWSAKHWIARQQEVVLVEGPADVWRLEQAGIHNGCAIFGSNVSRQQVALLEGLSLRRVITMMDNDEGGDAARASCDRLLASHDITHKIPALNDLGEMAPQDIKEFYHER